MREVMEYCEKLELLAYMVENGFDLNGRSMDDFTRDFSLADIRRFYSCFMGEDPTA